MEILGSTPCPGLTIPLKCLTLQPPSKLIYHFLSRSQDILFIFICSFASVLDLSSLQEVNERVGNMLS